MYRWNEGRTEADQLCNSFTALAIAGGWGGCVFRISLFVLLAHSYRACVEDKLKIVTLLLNHNANVNALDHDWWSPLHAAAAAGAARICSKLIASGADLTVINADGDLALDVADDERTEGVIERAMDTQGLLDKASQ